MLAANIWHWWIGVVLTLVSVAAVAGLIGGYLKTVTSQHYPSRRQRRDED
jgi:formate-dependent nitrite reductase membrane component NrfD